MIWHKSKFYTVLEEVSVLIVRTPHMVLSDSLQVHMEDGGNKDLIHWSNVSLKAFER